ncbi:sulfurtransferase complex subunit TusC [Vibrio sp. HA2012]|uniref:sulfurtransferase complex subunit TusC n=1 Tax=Vibrio sp. HA2012 TaxID=1971595 RepID=UPI000C2B5FAA|nr:sulfurtransferase complex subunit TusC [Vibrio sp. HA2012]PJC85741.1 sulfurtransferase complex subunit TusC [Vibrio sp. HA2012]
MSKIAFVFRSHPHSTACGREGLDALLAASAYSEELQVFFLGNGVTQLISGQDTTGIYSRDYLPAFRLMELYDIENVLICQSSMQEYGLSPDDLLIQGVILPRAEIGARLSECHKVITF